MITTNPSINKKRQYFHQLLVALGEEQYKEVIVAERFGVDSTLLLTEAQLTSLIADARQRLAQNSKPSATDKTQATIKRWRNKCLLALNERGIVATPKDWTAVNAELSKKQFQWVLTPAQREQGIINHKGLYAFTTESNLKKLFLQLVAIRDAERERDSKLKSLMTQN